MHFHPGDFFEIEDGAIAFILDEDGAVTVDWVVLTAAIIGMAMVFLRPVLLSTGNVADQLGSQISSVQPSGTPSSDRREFVNNPTFAPARPSNRPIPQ